MERNERKTTSKRLTNKKVKFPKRRFKSLKQIIAQDLDPVQTCIEVIQNTSDRSLNRMLELIKPTDTVTNIKNYKRRIYKDTTYRKLNNILSRGDGMLGMNAMSIFIVDKLILIEALERKRKI